MRIGLRSEFELGGLAGDADVDGEFPKPFQHLQQAVFGRQRDSDDNQVNAILAGVLRKLRNLAELLVFAHRFGAAHIESVIEDTDDLNVDIVRSLQGFDCVFGRFSAADDCDALTKRAELGAWPDPQPCQRTGETEVQTYQNKPADEPGLIDVER